MTSGHETQISLERVASSVPPDRSRQSHAYENMVEHLFLADLLRHMWYQRGEVVEVAQAQVDSWGYDVVLAASDQPRYVQLKASLPADVNERLSRRPGGCIVAVLPSQDGAMLRYRLWEATPQAIQALPAAKSVVYRRGKETRDARAGHRHVRQRLFGPPIDINALCSHLFPVSPGKPSPQR